MTIFFLGPYFKSTWTRQDAERHLANQQPNKFVLRPTTNKAGLMTLSFVHPQSKVVQVCLLEDVLVFL
jgi:hypothetical protein